MVEGETTHINQLQEQEDEQLQNHFTSVTEIKPGVLRLLTVKVVLAAVNFVARFNATRGNLSGIVTIHFARWVIIDGGRDGLKRLVFFSNYDGSWENYLGEFIDHASTGLTGIWSNSQLGPDNGFPKAKWLVQEGSRDEQKFKTYVRNSQRLEAIWFSAYTDLSVKNIHNNLAIRDQLNRKIEEICEWLRRF